MNVYPFRFHSLHLDAVNVPAFDVFGGEFCLLQLPSETSNEDYQVIKGVLLGDLPRENTRPCGVIWVDQFAQHASSLADLVDAGKLRDDTISALRGFREFKSESAYCNTQLSATATILLRLATAMTTGRLVVFSMALDPLGVLAVQDFVRSQLRRDNAAIQISRPSSPAQLASAHMKRIVAVARSLLR
jgi:hypothetical protein